MTMSELLGINFVSYFQQPTLVETSKIIYSLMYFLCRISF